MSRSPRPDPELEASLREELRRLGIAPPPASAFAPLAAHVRLLMEWNRRINLTAERELGRILQRHVAESLAALPHLPPAAAHLVDLGSGNGYPGLALAACRPGMRATLVESSRKKCAFLRAAAREAGLERVAIHCARIEPESGPGVPGPFDVFCSRAVAGMDRWAPALRDRIEPGGRGLFFVGAGEAGTLAAAAGQAGLSWLREPLPTREGAELVVVDYPGERSEAARPPSSRPA